MAFSDTPPSRTVGLLVVWGDASVALDVVMTEEMVVGVVELSGRLWTAAHRVLVSALLTPEGAFILPFRRGLSAVALVHALIASTARAPVNTVRDLKSDSILLAMVGCESVRQS